MRILITGATGLIGRRLTQLLLTQRHDISVLTRDPQRAQQLLGAQIDCWRSLSDRSSLDGIDAVINLAGEPIADKRWSTAQKQRLCHSRWEITDALSKLIRASANPPNVFISGSAVGYYGDQGAALVTEEETPHDEFTHQLCARWEALALSAASAHTRVCLLRTSVVLAADGGALAKMLPLYRLGLGGPLGNGKQYLPWIHIDDMVTGIHFLLTSEGLNGPFNMAAPYPVHNDQFSAILADVLDRPAFLRAPAFALRLIMGEAAVLVLGGQRVIPQRLEQAGFGFRFFELKEALTDLLQR